MNCDRKIGLYPFFWYTVYHLDTGNLEIWEDIHQALLSQFSLLAEFLIEKVPVNNEDSFVLVYLDRY